MLRITFSLHLISRWVEREKSKPQIFQKFMSILIGEADFFHLWKLGFKYAVDLKISIGWNDLIYKELIWLFI